MFGLMSKAKKQSIRDEVYAQYPMTKRERKIQEIRLKKWYHLTHADLDYWNAECLRVDARFNPHLAYAMELVTGAPFYTEGKPTELLTTPSGKVLAWPKNLSLNQPNSLEQLKAVITGLHLKLNRLIR